MEIRAIDGLRLAIDVREYAGRTHMNGHIELANGILKSLNRIDGAPEITMNTLRDEIYQDAVEHGLFEEFDKIKDPVRRRRALAMRIMEEAAEMYAAADDPQKFAEEGADVTIMTGDVFGYLGMDWHGAVCSKVAFNKGRPWKHGKE